MEVILPINYFLSPLFTSLVYLQRVHPRKDFRETMDERIWLHMGYNLVSIP